MIINPYYLGIESYIINNKEIQYFSFINGTDYLALATYH